jgi:hypothetical protein
MGTESTTVWKKVKKIDKVQHSDVDANRVPLVRIGTGEKNYREQHILPLQGFWP